MNMRNSFVSCAIQFHIVLELAFHVLYAQSKIPIVLQCAVQFVYAQYQIQIGIPYMSLLLFHAQLDFILFYNAQFMFVVRNSISYCVIMRISFLFHAQYEIQIGTP